MDNNNNNNNNGSDTMSSAGSVMMGGDLIFDDGRSDTNSTSSLIETQQQQQQQSPPMGTSLDSIQILVNSSNTITLEDDDGNQSDASSTSSISNEYTNSIANTLDLASPISSLPTTTSPTTSSSPPIKPTPTTPPTATTTTAITITPTTTTITSPNNTSPTNNNNNNNTNSNNNTLQADKQRQRRIEHSKSHSLDRINPNAKESAAISNNNNNKVNAISGNGQKSDAPPKRSRLDEMILATEAGNTMFLTKSLQSKPKIPLTQQLSNRSTFLHVACASFKISSVMFVFEQAPTLTNEQDFQLKTPLYICCEKGFFHAANFLLNCGASPILPDINKWTPLHKLASQVPDPASAALSQSTTNNNNNNNNNNNSNSNSSSSSSTSISGSSSKSQQNMNSSSNSVNVNGINNNSSNSSNNNVSNNNVSKDSQSTSQSSSNQRSSPLTLPNTPSTSPSTTQSSTSSSSSSSSPTASASVSQPTTPLNVQQMTTKERQKVGFTNDLQYEVAAKILTSKTQIISMRTSNHQTPLHVALASGAQHLYKLFISHSTEESLLIKDNEGNTPLHLVANLSRANASGFAQLIFDKLNNLSGDKLQEYIDDVNNSMASALQISMRKNNKQLTRLIIKYRAKAESKILDNYFENLNALKSTEATKLQLQQISYTDSTFRATPFGHLFRKLIVIIKQHYSINMTHQNANILLARAKDTIKKFFNWLDTNIPDTHHEYITNYKEILFSQTYDVIIHLYHEVYKSRDLFFQQRVSRYQDIIHSEIDITEDSWEQNVEAFPKALEIMKRLPEKRTPSEKINNLNEATSQIVRMDANDLTPMFMFLLIKSDLKNIASEFNFMDDFKDTPEQEQYLVLLQGSFDYLETLNYTLRNAQNQVMSLSGLVDRTIDNALSLCDEFRNSGVGADLVEDLDEGLKIQDEMVLLLMMISKLANRINNDTIYLPLTWSPVVMASYHFRAIIERLGVRLDQSLPMLIHQPTTPTTITEQTIPTLLSFGASATSSSSSSSMEDDNKVLIKKKGEICIILEHPYPQMVYQVIEEKVNEAVIKSNHIDK
ncbi:hypothetical protein PPL_09513 [Heterostelium album PN500]|uniref:VPS9 domain-containing protein n=1 Tax=Heterostelium pallidum (strain ATCC 26659 / Pp 5 / PN500) TaxID=670386 RepID=D3BNA2_HETP5|nr:hypothetical protein PPL_09513 [Heterostelium album PN500]EFA76762.1 hypothetical protein PPL_09513 [Heterostelium album PN500]|eukprot:XP_020428894.1 hypothetical protein PPL_09513 [Heterostelium album PN500]